MSEILTAVKWLFFLSGFHEGGTFRMRKSRTVMFEIKLLKNIDVENHPWKTCRLKQKSIVLMSFTLVK
jgi:hypothetical protein